MESEDDQKKFEDVLSRFSRIMDKRDYRSSKIRKRIGYLISGLIFVFNLPFIVAKLILQGRISKNLSITKDTLFVFGSGYSINDISDQEWKLIRKKGDTFAFNTFFRGNKVDIDYNIIREMSSYHSIRRASQDIKAFLEMINSHPRYKKVKLFICMHPVNIHTNLMMLVYKSLIKNDFYIYFNALRNSTLQPPSRNMWGIPHYHATLCDSVNIGACMGYKKIVLVGIDLYDRRYFFLDKDETKATELGRGNTCKDQHQTCKPLVECMDYWNKHFLKRGIKMYVYNPRSLLKEVLPLYDLKED